MWYIHTVKYNGTPLSNKKERAAYTLNNMDVSLKLYDEKKKKNFMMSGKKPCTKEYILYNSVFRKF